MAQSKKATAHSEDPGQLPEPNTGEQSSQDRRRTAADIQERISHLRDFSLDELARIPIVGAGHRLQQGSVYLDLGNASGEPITANTAMTVTEDTFYVAQAETPREYWDRLVAATAQTKRGDVPEEIVDKTLEDSFPTSDPPAWTTGRETDESLPQAPREKRVEPENK